MCTDELQVNLTTSPPKPSSQKPRKKERGRLARTKRHDWRKVIPQIVTAIGWVAAIASSVATIVSLIRTYWR